MTLWVRQSSAKHLQLFTTVALVAITVSVAGKAMAASGGGYETEKDSGSKNQARIGMLESGIRKMIETAIATGDDATIAAVFKVARQVAPDAGEEIGRYERTWKDRMAIHAEQTRQAELVRLREAGLLENWSGEIEAGASRSTGSTSSLGVLGSLEIKREGLDWSHKLSARAETQRANGETTADRAFTAWQPSYRFTEEVYAYGLIQYEHDPFAGYRSRYTLGGGLGYRVLDDKRLKIELEGGPALRRVGYVDGPARSQVAGRASLDLSWKITPTLSFTQKAALFIEGGEGNMVANTALDTKLIGNLKARFSYNVQYERNPPVGMSSFNTQSRATFVYGF